MHAIIQAQSLHKRYKNDVVAVQDVSFEVYEGEIFGMLGPNGAGKTTTMEMIEGLKQPTSGDAIVDGVSVANEPRSVKSRVGVQLQSSDFYELLTLKELVELFGNMYGSTVDRLELLQRGSLEEKAKSRPKQLSGGQKQRLSIAVAMANNPRVLFLDEPTTGLDPQARRHLWELVQNIRRSGTTVVLTTHYMDEAQTLCDRIAIMDQGTIIALDTPDNLIKSIGQQTVVQFTLKNADAFDIKPLTRLGGVTNAEQHELLVELKTTDAQQTLIELIQYDQAHPVNFEHLSVRETNLEDVFLSLTGKRLRDE